MQDQSTYVLSDLPLIRCGACGRGIFRAATYGLISMICQKCHATTIYSDGQAALTQMRGRALTTIPHDVTPNQLMALLEGRWRRLVKERAVQKAEMAVGIRFKVFTRDAFACRYCGRKASDGAVLEVDHVVPRSKGGDDSLTNLVTACWECNRGKAAEIVIEGPPANR